MSVYPNPATTAFTMQVPALAGVVQVKTRLYNALGAQLDFGTAGLAPGIYTLRVQAGEASIAKQVSIR